MAEDSANKKIAAAWLSNQVVIYVLLGLTGIAAIYLALPWLRAWFSGLIDKILGFFQGFIPKPKSQDAGQRGVVDEVEGLFYANDGDRAFSDFASLDFSSDYASAAEGQAIVKNEAWLESMGYVDKNGNFTAKGNAWRASLEQTKLAEATP